MRIARLLALAPVFLFASVVFSQTTPAPSPKPIPMVAPLFIENSDFTSTLGLVNVGAEEQPVIISVQDMSGREVANARVRIGEHSSMQVQIGDLLKKAGSAANIGSVLVTTIGNTDVLPVATHMSITSHVGLVPAYFEQEIDTPE